ncbi:MAG: bis(5'-nucleosyl)-tetraphosphatase (symmetrical) YqeK [Lachnospiraceae bacterium]|nr:bis(5'-nucleosyl)-tetraphosphatase (symmetrical) YqeK [Lachnospiraceae bacterium]
MQQEKFVSIKKALKKELDKERYQHTLAVAYTACCLAMRWEADLDSAYIAGLLHDCAKNIPDEDRVKLCGKWGLPVNKTERKNPTLLHAKMGAYLAVEKYGVDDPDILRAIEFHTTGRPGMSTLEKIIFVADYIEPYRFKAENLTLIRYEAFVDLDCAISRISGDTFRYLQSKEPDDIDPMTEEVFRYYTHED